MVKELASGLVLGYAAIALLHGCSGAQQIADCELRAVRQLPAEVVSDPDTLTVGDVRGLARRLKVCQQGDAGQ